MKRTEKTIQNYKVQLLDKGIDNIPEFVDLIISADITKGKYTRFLLDCFIADKFRMEDLQGGLESTIGEAISLFHKHKNKLPEEMRSTNKYVSPGDLWQAVREFETVMTGKEEKRSEKEKAYSETEFIYHDEDTGFQIVSPLTEHSAKWWGKGTRWCTSAENNNMFEEYAKKSPLFIILMPDNSKLQLWKNGSNIQYVDEADNKVSINYIENNWQYLEKICLSLNDLSLIPEKYRTPEIYRVSLQNNGMNLKKIPNCFLNRKRTSELCKIAIEQNIESLQYIPKKYITQKLCKLAVKKDGKVLKYVPNKYKTLELCEIAVKQSGSVLRYIPKEYRTPELCKLAIEQDGWDFKFVPEEYKTPELYRIAVERNTLSLRSVPEELKTPKLCQLAIEQDGYNLRFVPEELKTPELCQIAVEQNGDALRYVPDEYKTYELYQIAIQSNGLAFIYLPNKYITQELCLLAIKQNGGTLDHIPDEYKTPEMYKIAVEQNGLVLQFVPKKYKTPELCQLAVKYNGWALLFVSDELKTPELCQLAIEQNRDTLRLVPNKIKSQIGISEFILPDYTEQYDQIRSLFPEKILHYKL